MENKKENVDVAIVLASLQEQAKPLLKQLAKINVSDNVTYERKAVRIEALKHLAKLAIEKEKSLVDPLTKVIKDIKGLFAPFKKMVDAAEAEAKAEMLEYYQETEKQKAKIAEKLSSGKIKNMSTAVKNMAALDIVSTSSSLRNQWVLEMVDENETPREYLVPDEVKIKAAFKAGKSVPGWRYVQKKNIAI